MVLILLLSVAFLVLLERKVLGRVQLRTRPVNVGWWGVLQTVIDGLKLLNKPSAIKNHQSFTFLVLIIVLSYVVNMYILMVVILGGILSIFLRVILRDNLYGKMGAYRMVILSWGYDILLLVMLLILPKVIIMILIIYYVLSIEVGRTPIDLIEGESELVSGFNTEYAGGEFVRFFLGEYLRILILLVIVISVEFILVMVLYMIVIYVRASYPRKKYNEVVISMWKYMVLMLIVNYIV